MKRSFLAALLGTALAMSAAGQNGPKPKSNEEIAALQAMFGATDTDAQIAAAQHVLEKFADSEFKSIALQTIAGDYQRKGDFPKAVTFAERALEADPKNYQAMLVLASEYVQNTKDTDFDKEDKLKKSEKYANDTITVLKDAPKPSDQLPDADWEAARKDMTANAHEILGQVAMTRKKPDAALTEFKAASEMSAKPEPSTLVRLAQANNMLGKYDDAIAAAEKAMSMPNASPTVKQFAQAERARAVQKKSGAAPAASAPPPSSAPPAGTTTPSTSPSPTPAPTAPPKP